MNGIGLLFLTVLVFSVPAMVFWRRCIVGHDRVGSRCHRCGYDWRKSTSGCCPECGTAHLKVGTRPPMRGSLRTLYAILASILSLVVVTVGREVGVGLRMPLMDGTSSLREIAAGKAERDEIVASVREALRDLSNPMQGMTIPVNDPALVIRNGAGTKKFAAVAEILQSTRISEAQFDAVLQAIADEYRERTIFLNSSCDILLADMLAQSRSRRFPVAAMRSDAAASPIRELTPKQRHVLVELFLDLQARPDRPWNEEWGRALEGAGILGHLNPEQARRYIENRYVVEAKVSDLTYAGDLCVVQLSFFRRGSDYDFPISVRVTSSDPTWHDRLRGGAIRGQVIRRNLDEASCIAFLPDSPGDAIIPLDVEVTFDKQAIKDSAEYFDSLTNDAQHCVSLAKRFPSLVGHKQVSVRLQLLQSPVAPVTVTQGEATAQRFGDGMDLYPDYWPMDGGAIVSIEPTVVWGGMGHAAQAFVRQDGVEHPIGWCFKSRLGDCVINAVGFVPGLDVNRDAEVVLRSDVGPLLRPVWTPRLWDGEVVRPLKFQKDRPTLTERPPFVRMPT